jgi:hypothetical protein
MVGARVSPETSRLLALCAEIDGVTASDAIRRAIGAYVNTVSRRDPGSSSGAPPPRNESAPRAASEPLGRADGHRPLVGQQQLEQGVVQAVQLTSRSGSSLILHRKVPPFGAGPRAVPAAPGPLFMGT